MFGVGLKDHKTLHWIRSKPDQESKIKMAMDITRHEIKRRKVDRKTKNALGRRTKKDSWNIMEKISYR